MTVTFVRMLAAPACQISAAPGWRFAAVRRVHVSPPPVTDEKLCPPPDGPSEVTKATSSSFVWWVVTAPEVRVEAAADWWVLTVTSTAIVAANAAGLWTSNAPPTDRTASAVAAMSLRR